MANDKAGQYPQVVFVWLLRFGIISKFSLEANPIWALAVEVCYYINFYFFKENSIWPKVLTPG